MSQRFTGQISTGICSKDSVKKTGLNIWAQGEHDGDSPKVDIVAVQGLGAHPYYTWVFKPEKTKPANPRRFFRMLCTHKNDLANVSPGAAQTESDPKETMWLRDFLPDQLPHARIASYSYESDCFTSSVKTSLRQCGEQLLNVLLQNRSTDKERQRPLILIGHSIGGLVIKQALVLADHGDTFRDVRMSLAAMIFLGAPHQGSNAAGYGVWLARAAGRDTTLLESLKRNSSTLYDIASDFEKSYGPEADIVCFYEHENASYELLRTQFVEQQSASLLGKRAMFLQTDHSGMNKFSGPNDANFHLVGQEIDRMVKEAPPRVEERFRFNAVGPGQIQKKQFRRDDEARLLEALASDYKGDKDLISERVSGTCEWLFGDDRFLEWRDSDGSRLLWLTTGPGCGKSVLAKALIDERMACTKTKTSTICYFFFKDGQDQRTRAADALSAILHQLFQNTNLATYALDSYKSHGKELRNRFSELWEILIKSAEDPQAGEIICVLDALDESEDKARIQLMDKLFQFFSQEGLYQNPHLRLKFLITSRPYDELELKFQKLSGVSTYIRFDGDEKSLQIGQEINLVIDAKVPYITGGFDDNAREKVCNRLKEMQNRTYLWLFLTIDIIEKSPSNYSRTSDIHSLLSDLPSEVSDAYERILSRSKDMAKARILLEIIVAATRPLSLQEANMALVIATQNHSCKFQKDLELWPEESFGSTVRNFCGLFVNIHDGKLSLIHQTAREFLLRRTNSTRSPLPKWEGSLIKATAHGTMFRVCLSYLNFEDRASIDQSCLEKNRSSTTPVDHLMDYAANDWATHYNSQPAELAKNTLRDAMSLCRTSESQARWFLRFRELRSEKPEGWTALGTACLLGLAHVAEELLNEGADINAYNQGAGSALGIASRNGSDHIVRMLLDKAAVVDVQDEKGFNALMMASRGGYFHIAQMLVDKGANVNAQDFSGVNVLSRASETGHGPMIRMLLDKGADINAQNLSFTPLHAASSGDHAQIGQMLLDNGADINAQSKLRVSALQQASAEGHAQTVQMLLDNGADINAQSKLRGSALQQASASGHAQTVQMLLDNGADINAQSKLHGSALQKASASGHVPIVKMLLNKRADVNAQSWRGSALETASLLGHVQVVRLLLDNGATDADGDALYAAASQGHDHIVQMLLDDRGEDYARGGESSEALHYALKAASVKGHDQVVRILQAFNMSAR